MPLNGQRVILAWRGAPDSTKSPHAHSNVLSSKSGGNTRNYDGFNLKKAVVSGRELANLKTTSHRLQENESCRWHFCCWRNTQDRQELPLRIISAKWVFPEHLAALNEPDGELLSSTDGAKRACTAILVTNLNQARRYKCIYDQVSR